MKKRTSIYDMARILDVSVSTVSRALKDHPSISAALKEKVRELAAELHYTPNSVAVNLKTGKRNTIGVVVPSINRSFFSSAIEGIEDEAYQQGYDVLIYQSKDSAEREERIVDSLTGKVDGVIASVAADATDHSYYNHLTSIGIPLVLFDRTAEVADAGTVIADDFQGAYQAVTHLIEQGFTNIYHIAGPQHVSIWRNRCAGYRAALEHAGMTSEGRIFTALSTSRGEGSRGARDILRQCEEKGTPLPDAIFCAGDFTALGAMLELDKAGLNIPEQIAVVGYANEPFCDLLTVPLTSVDQFSYKMGNLAGKMLFERLAGEPQVGMVIAPELVIRRSSLKKDLQTK